MDRELDPEGVPRRLAVDDWGDGLGQLASAILSRPTGCPDRVEGLAEGWFLAYLRLSRPDGSRAFGRAGPDSGARTLLRFWAERLPDPGYSTVLGWWFGSKESGRPAPPPLPADSRPDRPLAILRANWRKDGEFLAIDHREASARTLVEFCARGRPWLGPAWTSAEVVGAVTPARPTLWRTLGSCDLAEWGFRVGKARVVRTALYLRGRSLALLAESWDGPGDPGGWEVEIAGGVEARPLDAARGFALDDGRSRCRPRVLAIGLPTSAGPTEKGGLSIEGTRLVLRQKAVGPRSWRPLLLSWDPPRDRRPITWRALTVTEDRRVCRPDEAFAARVTWGRGETLLIYRSLKGPATRAVLGHQTRARFLVGLFNATGDVEPLLKIEE